MACTIVCACGSDTDQVRQVAEAFWDASKAGDMELAQTYVSESSTFRPNQSDNDSPPGDVKLGRIEVNGDEATVETTVTGLNEETPFDVEFETAMVLENGEWKVNMDKTAGSMMQGAFAAMAEAMGSAMSGLAEGMAGALKEGFENMGDSLANTAKR
jgi:hypothetical protein